MRNWHIIQLSTRGNRRRQQAIWPEREVMAQGIGIATKSDSLNVRAVRRTCLGMKCVGNYRVQTTPPPVG